MARDNNRYRDERSNLRRQVQMDDSMRNLMDNLYQQADDMYKYSNQTMTKARQRHKLADALTDSLDRLERDRQKLQVEIAEKELRRLREEYNKSGKTDSQKLDIIDRMNGLLKERNQIILEENARFKKAGSEFISQLSSLAQKIGKTVDEVTNIGNSMIQATGVSTSDMQSARSNIYSTVSNLNDETGSYFSAKEAFASMTNLANSIGDIDKIEEMTRPILLAQESMNVNTESLATLFAKWSTRYGFDSLQMESMVNDIRGNTANNLASADAIVANISKLEDWAVIAAGGNSEKLEQMTESISKGSAWLESQGIDSAQYTDYMLKIASDQAATDTELIQVLAKAGLSVADAKSLFDNGNVDSLYESLFKGMSAYGEEIVNNPVSAQTAQARGMDINTLASSYAAILGENFQWLKDFDPDEATAADVVEGKYTSLADKISHNLEGIYDTLAEWQEDWGFGLTDILGIATNIASAIGLVKGAGALTSLAGGAATAGGGGLLAGAGGALAAAAPWVVGGAAVLAGGYAIWDTFIRDSQGLAEELKKEYDEEKDKMISGITSQIDILQDMNISLSKGEDYIAEANELIESGILTAEEESELRKAVTDGNIDALKKLTESFISARQTFSGTAQEIFDEESRKSLGAARDAQDTLRNILDDLNDNSLIEDGSDRQKKISDVMWMLMKDLEENESSLDEDSKQMLEVMRAGAKDGNFDASEINDILDDGWNNRVFQDTNFSADAIRTAGQMLADSQDKVLSDLGTKVGDAMKDVMTSEEIRRYAETNANKDLTDKGYSGSMDGYKKVEGSHAEGLDYVPHDGYIAELHEGEAVIPKRFNPKSDTSQSNILNLIASQKSSQSDESLTYMKEFSTTLVEIKEFLDYWRKDSIARESTIETRRRFSNQNTQLANYTL